MERIKEVLKSLMDYVGRMTASQVMMLFGVVAGTIIGGIYFAGWVNNVSYSRLYSNLDESEAGEIVSYLSENKIPYNLTDGGRTIEIPSNDVYKTRISLASEGMPRSGNIGYSIFDQNNLGMTDFLQNLNFRRALEGELTRTIMQLSEVDAARVHIVIPKDRLFKKDKQEATASIVLKLRRSNGLDKQQIKGITHLVAASVEGLKPSNISIVDYDGNLLSSGSEEDPLAGLSSSQLEVRKQVEEYLENKAQTMMDKVLGANQAIIRVTADLNFSQLEKTSETYDPNTASVRSEERTKSTANNTDKPAEDAEKKEDSSNETVITNYELNKTVEHLVDAIGSIDRLSIACMVDGHYTSEENADGVTEMIYQPRSQEELDRLAAIVKNAVGFDQERTDQIEMINIAFNRNDFDLDREALDSMYMQDFYLDIAKKIGLFLLVAIALLYFKRKSKKLFGALSKIVPSVAPSTRVVERVIERSGDNNQPLEQPSAAPAMAEIREPRLVDKMQTTAKDKPEEIAKVIKTIMAE